MQRALAILLFGCCFTLAVIVEPKLAYTQVYARHDNGPVEVILGDARRLFAGYFFTKADVYFHSGYYPGIFDEPLREDHLGSGARSQKPQGDFIGKPRDWIDRFSRSFYPSVHVHLDSAGKAHNCEAHGEHDHDHGSHEEHGDEAHRAAEMREILPWLTIAAELDPNRIETYTVGAYWLRTRMSKPQEAEQFLRDGLRSNPGSHAILFELGRVYKESYQDPGRARNVWELALKRWNEQESPKLEPDTFALLQINWQLAQLERESGNFAKAIAYLQTAKRVSPNPDEVQKRIDEIQAHL